MTDRTKLLLPVLIGAAAAAGIAYLLISDDTAELREQLENGLGKIWGSVKEKALDKIADIRSGAEALADKV
jgi:hypothetical protein